MPAKKSTAWSLPCARPWEDASIMIVLYFAPVSAASVGHRISGSGVVEGV